MSGAAPTATLEQAARALDGIAQTMARARRAAEHGVSVDLAGLERSVDGLCAMIEDLPKAEGRSLEARLLGLVDDLTTLAGDLERQRGPARPDRDIGVHRAAVDAYGKPKS